MAHMEENEVIQIKRSSLTTKLIKLKHRNFYEVARESLVKGVLPMKAKRHAKLLELIHNNDIYTQEDLMRHLQSAGFDVTQATVSRDIKRIASCKMLSGNGKYKYSTGKEPTRPTPPKFDSLFADAIESIEPAMNMIAVKCMPGMALGYLCCFGSNVFVRHCRYVSRR